MGWMMGLEPTTPGATVRCSTIELHPPCFVQASRPEGIEPPTDGLEIRCSIQLSYGRTTDRGAPGSIGARGFEPPTPCAQGRCATGLRYAPVVAGAEQQL